MRIPKNQGDHLARRYTTDKLTSTTMPFVTRVGNHFEYAIYRLEGTTDATNIHPTVTRQYSYGGVPDQFPNRLAMQIAGRSSMTWHAEDGTLTAGPEIRNPGEWGCSDKNTEDPAKAGKFIKHTCLDTPTIWYCVFLYELVYMHENVTPIFTNPGDEVVIPDPEPGTVNVLALFEGKAKVGNQIRNAPFVADLPTSGIPTKKQVLAIEPCIGLLITNCVPREYDEQHGRVEPPDATFE